MSDISNIYSNVGATNDSASLYKTQSTKEADKAEASSKKSNVKGKVIGEPQLSDKAAAYYDKLKSKFHNMDFILVSKDQKENAKQHAVSYANASKTVVLIDEEKIERMANDEEYRKQYEGIIEKAQAGFAQVKSQAEASGANVVGYGMEVNDDGTATLFAVLEKQSVAQSERIAEKRAEKKAAAKAEAKKEAKERQAEKLEEAKEARAEQAENATKTERTLISANSFEELFQKIGDYLQNEKVDSVRTEAEKAVGQNIDFSA